MKKKLFSKLPMLPRLSVRTLNIDLITHLHCRYFKVN